MSSVISQSKVKIRDIKFKDRNLVYFILQGFTSLLSYYVIKIFPHVFSMKKSGMFPNQVVNFILCFKNFFHKREFSQGNFIKITL